ncbi:hypothetical protein VaNZ11_015081 [Volvox africanus]|uniref:Mitochondrial carrier protein n=1 Tax=Volvox africanus TaxID=51714 RepID=A0ABQ5SJR1_9CHLO|nr:hypothetical protein VaNZ11_015081 [Volvox africanus]
MAAQTAELRQPDLFHRIVAAAGASVVSALLVNPLDVIKTRVQAASIVADQPVPTCLLSRNPHRFPVRWARLSSLSECQSLKLPVDATTGCMGPGGGPGSSGLSTASHLPRRLLLGQLPMSSCACAVKVTDLGPERLGAPARCHNAQMYRPVTASAVLAEIVHKEGLTALWRGTDTAMLVSIPMVGVYMPLYDYLLQRTAAPLASYAPLVAGSAARTLAVLLVGPLELVRTRQQGTVGGARTAWAALRETFLDASGPRDATAGPARSELLRAAPRLWTGVVATLARDVPFSAIYWGLVENMRGRLLARWQQQAALAVQAPVMVGGFSSQLQQRREYDQQQPLGPSSRAVFAVNLVSGSAAGAVAALVTTPFDVVKTQLQLGSHSIGNGDGSPSSSSSSSSGGSTGRVSGSEVARRILREEGVAGLFRGWAPRAARTAPACAVVVASYEVLKLML